MNRFYYALTVLVPGLGHVARGMWLKGVLFMAFLAAHSGTAYLAVVRSRMPWQIQPFRYTVSTGTLTVAFATLVAIPVVVWLVALLDMRRALRPRRRDEPQGYWQVVGRRFSKDVKGLVGLSIVLIAVYVALQAPFLSESDARRNDLVNFLAPPGQAGNLLGTDNMGRNVLDRIIFGAQVDLGIGVVATLFNMALGGMLGLIAGYFRGLPDAVLMRVLEVINAIPFLVLALLAVSLFGSSVAMLILVLGIFGIDPARIIRSEVLSIRENDYVVAAKALGVPTPRIVLRHVMPNAIASLIVVATMYIGVNIIVVAGLSFLGFGVRPPTPSWGSMLQEAQAYMRSAWWMAVFPGLCIVTTVFGFNILGDSLRDVLDPRLK